MGSVDIASSPQTVSSRMRPTSRVAHRDVGPRRLLEVFVIFELLCQLALLWSVLGEFRFFFRLATFASNLALMVILPKRDCRYHPAAKAAQWIIAIMCLELLNPQSNAKVAGIAEILLYLAILGPLFWVPRVGIDLKAVRNVMLILWIFYTISSGIGILQVYYPGSFRFNVSSIYSHGSLQGLMYVNGQGHLVYRPSGLSDVQVLLGCRVCMQR